MLIGSKLCSKGRDKRKNQSIRIDERNKKYFL